MKLTILGSGVCVPVPERCQSSYLLETERNRILFDMGSGAFHRLSQAGVDYFDIETICLSHLHCDHMSDIVPFFFGTNYHPEKIRKKPLLLIGPPGTRKWVKGLFSVHGAWIIPRSYSLSIMEKENSSVDLNGETLTAVSVYHSAHTNGYRLKDARGKVFAFTGDSSWGPNLVKLAHEADILLSECSFPDREMDKHLNAKEVARLGKESSSRRILLTHIYPGYENFSFSSVMDRIYKGTVSRVEDLDVFEI